MTASGTSITGLDRNRIADGVVIERYPRRVRAYFGGAAVADSTRVLLVFDRGHIPTYWFPADGVRTDLLTPARDHASPTGVKRWDLRVGDQVARYAAASLANPDPDRAPLANHFVFSWNQMDAWFEEDDEVFVHARDPYTRVDVLNSSRHVRVEYAGQLLAESRRPRLLFETHLPTRYYLPKQDVRMDLLEPTSTLTRCPYKGEARYWSLRLGERLISDLVWSYPYPIPEIPKIENLLCFFNEQVDITVDGELQPRPVTAWS